MVVSCEQVWRELSNYLEGEVDPTLRAAFEEHVRGCKHCTALLDGTRNIVHLFGDDRLLEVPSGFSQRLHHRLAENMPQPRGNVFGWLLAVAAAALVAGGLVVGDSAAFTRPALRSEHAQPAINVPADLMVAVTDNGKTFHVPGCRFLHEKKEEKVRLMTARQATQEGYVPCVRCMRKYLTASVISRPVARATERRLASDVQQGDGDR